MDHRRRGAAELARKRIPGAYRRVRILSTAEQCKFILIYSYLSRLGLKFLLLNILQENVFNLGRMSLGLYYLNEAMVGGHSGATYFRGILLFGDHQTRQTGIELLKKAKDGAGDSEMMKICVSYVEQCQMKVSDGVWNNTWSKTWNKYSQRLEQSCTNPTCGKFDGWEQRRGFCSEFCKWNFEYLLLYLYM